MVAKQLVQRPISWADCLGIARLKFEKYFRHKVSSYGNKVGSHDNKVGSHGNKVGSHDNKVGSHDNKVGSHGNKVGVVMVTRWG